MIGWRHYRYLLPALLASLLLHLLFGFGLNVYGSGPTAAKAPTRLTIRLTRPPTPAAAPQPPVAEPGQRRPLPVLAVPDSALTVPERGSEHGKPPAIVEPAPETAAAVPESPVALPEAPLPQMPTLGLMEIPDLRFLPASEVDVVAKPASPIIPNFPIQLQHSNVAGLVVILLKIDENGGVVDAEIEYADPPGTFDQTALGPFIHARFTPAMKNGLPVRSEKRIEIMFGDYQRPLFGPPMPAAGR